jgi:hypothetical protein
MANWTTTGNAGTNPPTEFLGTTDSKPLVFKTQGAAALQVQPGGNVGIGTATPQFRLHVAGDRIILSAPSGEHVLHLRVDGAAIDIAGAGAPLYLNNGTGQPTLINPGTGNVGVGTTGPQYKLHVVGDRIVLSSADGQRALQLRVDGAAIDVAGVGAPLYLNNTGQPTLINASGGNVGIGTDAPTEQLHVHGNALVTGDIKLAGADCAEEFPLAGSVTAAPGTVLVIADDGGVCPSTTAYDRRVAGLVAGAGQYRPGVILDACDDGATRVAVSLVGKGYCLVDAAYGAIGVGDLLTTSATPGHAMKAGDPARAFGATLGKALGPLAEGRGLIPVLLALQ